jgi:hypothetical protein
MPDPVDQLRAVADGLAAAPPEMSDYLTKVREHAYTVTDADLEALLEAGCTQDEIFEQTVGVAIREGLRRFDRVREVLG